MPLTDTTLLTDTSLLTAAGESTPALAVTQLGQRGMQVLVGGRDLTNRCDTLVFSAVDNGGFEICTLGLPAADRPLKGTPVTIRQGLSIAWMGRVAEIADHSSHAHATKTVGCEGYQALLKDNQMSMIYVDRALAQFQAPSTTRAIELQVAKFQQGNASVGTDVSGNNPALLQAIAGDWASPWRPLVESWYDAGAGNLIGAIFAKVAPFNGAFATTKERESINFCTRSDLTGPFQTGVNLNNLGAGFTGLLTASPATQFAYLEQLIDETPQGIAGSELICRWLELAVFGPHGLTRRGEDPGGFYPSDIVRHALSQLGGITTGNIQDATGYIAPHVVYRTPTDYDVVINDMARLMGWTWGVWGPTTALGDQPRLDFRAPPSDATVAVSKAECDELDITSRLGDLYDTCVVSYTDPAGSTGKVTVSLANPQLYEAGIASRTLELTAGTSTEAAAGTLGQFALALSQVAARGAGQVTLPDSVKLIGGGSRPSSLLRPGLDRLRITDLIDGGPLLEQGTSRRDVFRISRTETTIGKDGVVSTRAELDNGTNLLETLQARLALAAGVIGAGAGGG